MLALILAISLASYPCLVAADCNSSPVVIPITDVLLSNNQKLRGASVAVGADNQVLSFLVHTTNNTYIYDTQGQCDTGTTTAYCKSFRGDLFDTKKSSSWVSQDSVAAAGGDKSDTEQFGELSKTIWGKDSIRLNSNISVPTMPLGVQRVSWQGAFVRQHVLGFGRNSTLLTALKNAGRIQSRAWSFFWGLQGATSQTQMDGSIVLGGYDKAKVIGDKITFPLVMDGKCSTGMLVTLSQIVMNFPNGTAPDILKGTALSACIQPDFPSLMTIPEKQFKNFMDFAGIQWDNVSRSFGVNFWNMIFSNANTYYGDLTMVIGGLQVRIPNHQLVLPDLAISGDGTIAYNTSAPYKQLIVNELLSPNDGDLPIIGRQFFSSAMLMVDYDQNTFSLWKANPTKDTNLVQLQNGNSNSTCSSTFSTPAVTDIPKKSKPLSTGAIIGIVVGSIAGLAFLALIVLCVLKRRKRQNQKPLPEYQNWQKHESPMTLTSVGSPQEMCPMSPREMMADTYGSKFNPVEMPATEIATRYHD